MTDADPQLIDDVVSANHILYNEGVVDGFGHVTARHDKRPDRFLIARSMAPGLVTAADLMECDLEGTPHDAAGRRSYVERFIHSAIYKARPEVMAVVHSHSPAVVPFSVTGARLRPICHMCGFLGQNTPVFEIRDIAGAGSDLLIRTQAMGEALAKTLGGAAVALMRGHGSVTVGASVKQVVYRAIYAEVNAALQSDAMRLGDINFLTPAEAAAAALMNDEHLDRPWQLWKLAAARARLQA
jgi:HCOMODA/2-hydroxy-3-carboxy-muconic semialdehyde decarboxylase